MGLTYFKRFRMEIDLRGRDFSDSRPPRGYRFLSWDRTLVEAHAEVKYLSFRSEIDANVFPCLGDYSGCLRLMYEISRKPGFLQQSTWLLATDKRSGSRTGLDGLGANRMNILPVGSSILPIGSAEPEYVGTIQGIMDSNRFGAVQNLGIVPEQRGLGLGSCLMLKALEGFQLAGLSRAMLEVTSRNDGAIRLYRRLGFSKIRTVYKVVEVAYS
ncbi:MAG: GNAT family N-acetyltransferase [Planctomycetota bacterium]|nr:GNAT family N-acetyltransferase [Planctomycetota bacterium]